MTVTVKAKVVVVMVMEVLEKLREVVAMEEEVTGTASMEEGGMAQERTVKEVAEGKAQGTVAVVMVVAAERTREVA